MNQGNQDTGCRESEAILLLFRADDLEACHPISADFFLGGALMTSRGGGLSVSCPHQRVSLVRLGERVSAVQFLMRDNCVKVSTNPPSNLQPQYTRGSSQC